MNEQVTTVEAIYVLTLTAYVFFLLNNQIDYIVLWFAVFIVSTIYFSRQMRTTKEKKKLKEEKEHNINMFKGMVFALNTIMMVTSILKVCLIVIGRII